MAVSARLSRKLRESLGEESADDLISWMVKLEERRSELQEVFEAWKATTDFRFAAFEARVDARFVEQERSIDARFAKQERSIDARFAQQEKSIDARFAHQEKSIDARFAEQQRLMESGFAEQRRLMESGLAEMRQSMAHLETRFERRFGDLIKWSFVFWCGAIGAVAMLAKALG